MLPHIALLRESRISLSAGAACTAPIIFPIYLLHWLIQRPFPSRSPSLMTKYVVEEEEARRGWKGDENKGRGRKSGATGKPIIHQPSPGSSLHSWLTRKERGEGRL